MTHILDTSAVLAQYFDEPGADRVDALLRDPATVVGISVLTLYEMSSAIWHQTRSLAACREAVAGLRLAISKSLPVSEEIVEIALELRHNDSARIALADCCIAATATGLARLLFTGTRTSHLWVLESRGKKFCLTRNKG